MLLEAQSSPPEPAFPVDLGKQSTLKVGCKSEATVPPNTGIDASSSIPGTDRSAVEQRRVAAEKKNRLDDQQQGRARSQTHTLKLVCNFPWEES